MHAIVLDTETTSLAKPFCYDLGYCIINMDTHDIVKTSHYVIEQVWHNLPLFESAYYKEKRPLYVRAMRARKAILEKWGYVMQALARDIKAYDVHDVYAYNSNFDDNVFSFNCDWFKTINPLENVGVHDIWGYSSAFITNSPEYLSFCEEHNRYTDTGNYSGSAESVYQYISNDFEFVEDHNGVSDAIIEARILSYCIECGAEWATDYDVKKVLPRKKFEDFSIVIDGETVYKGKYWKKYVRNNVYKFTTK